MWTCAGVLALAACACALTRDQLYPYGPALDQKLPRGSEIASPEIPLKVRVIFYGETYESIYVNNFGVVSFRTDISSFLNAEFPLPYPAIAAFYSKVDTTESGAIYYRETSESHVLLKAEEIVQNNFHDYYDFHPSSVFIATWFEVQYSGGNQKNTYQIAIISNGTESFVEFLYPDGDVQWIQKETQPGELPDAKAQAGFVAEDGRILLLRGSGSHQIRNIVSWSNAQEPGKYVYRIGNIPPDGNIAAPDLYNQNEVEIQEESKTCAQSGPSVCHMQARCVDYIEGICCKCNEGFYGNGKSCVKDDAPLRVHGKLNGIINDVSLNDVDIQAYVVVADGRSYTALSQAPGALGSSLQLVNVLGGVVGWLFAKPSGAALNGYQLTGAVFNHTADIFFPATNNRVTLVQEYVGHDVFDQIALDSDVRGSLPQVDFGAKLQISEYEEQYTLIEPGLIRSESTRTLVNPLSGAQYEQRVSQTIIYSPCHNAPASQDETISSTLRVNKNYLGFEPKDNIVRYGMSNRIMALGQEDPCIVGRSTCGPHSSCVVQGTSFTCVCESGFTNVYQNDAVICIDIDECTAGTHNCDTNADCYNHDGGFQCRCRDGFEGNGIACSRLSLCKDKTCNQYAQCIEGYNGGEATCVCIPGYTGNGQRCWVINDFTCDVLHDCSPYATCNFSPVSNSHICQCNSGFIGDGKNCILQANTDTSTPPPLTTAPAPAPTTPVSIDEPENIQFVLPSCNGSLPCQCPIGYTSFRDERGNDLCRLDSYDIQNQTQENDTTIFCNRDSDCPSGAVCSYSLDPLFGQYVSRCACPTGYEGNPYECVEVTSSPTQPQETNETLIRCTHNLDCPPNAECIPVDPNYGTTSHCVCPAGYVGDAYECIEPTSETCYCGANAHCYRTASGDKCVCDVGYYGDGYTCKPKLTCTNSSDCDSHSECRLDVGNQLTCQCIEGYIKDENEACIPDRQLCNGGMCAEHASCLLDEVLEIHYCHCDQGYSGEGTIQCFAAEATCDVVNNCHENAVCTPIESSYQCVCREDFIGDGYDCRPEPSCRTDPTMCDVHAVCIKRSGGYVCECNAGFTGNGADCVQDARQTGNFLVASDGVFVYRVPFQATARDYARPINSGTDQIAVGIDTDCQSGKIYWGDVISNTIKRANYDGSSFELFLNNDIKAPEGVAVDWAARNIFWTDAKKLTIEVANLDTKVRKVLVSVDMTNPRGIAVHPRRGKIFWTDWNRKNPKIEWANMDGSERGVLVDSTEVKLPNSVAVDWERDRLCYTDAGLVTIKCVNLDTLEIETVVSDCLYPFGLAIKRDTFYWTDWKTFKLQSLDTRTQRKGELPIGTAPRRLYGVALAPDQCPPSTNVCQFRNGNCDPGQLCLPNGQGNRVCANGDSESQS